MTEINYKIANMKPENFLKVILLVDLIDTYTSGLQMNQRAKQLLTRCQTANKAFVKFIDTGVPYKDLEMIGELSDELSNLLDDAITFNAETETFSCKLKR